MRLTPYLMFNGNCEEALNFYATTIGGEIKHLSRYEGSPVESSSNEKQKILHASFEGNGIALLASDDMKDSVSSTGNVHLCLDFKDAQAMDNVFEALSRGGKVTMPLRGYVLGCKVWNAHRQIWNQLDVQ